LSRQNVNRIFAEKGYPYRRSDSAGVRDGDPPIKTEGLADCAVYRDGNEQSWVRVEELGP